MLHLSCLLGIPVVGPVEQHVGRLVDVIARLAGETMTGTWHPSVTGLVVDYDGQDRFAHAHEIESLSYEAARLTVDPKVSGPVRAAVRGGPVGQGFPFAALDPPGGGASR